MRQFTAGDWQIRYLLFFLGHLARDYLPKQEPVCQVRHLKGAEMARRGEEREMMSRRAAMASAADSPRWSFHGMRI